MIERDTEDTEMDSESSSEDSGETATIPSSLVGDQEVSPGDVIRLSVVSVGDGTITVEYEHPDESKGSDAMAAEFETKKEPMA